MKPFIFNAFFAIFQALSTPGPTQKDQPVFTGFIFDFQVCCLPADQRWVKMAASRMRRSVEAQRDAPSPGVASVEEGAPRAHRPSLKRRRVECRARRH